jgi:RNA polymerase sigma factor (sigma-70 family)
VTDDLSPILDRLADSRYDNAGWDQLYKTLWPVIVGTLTRRHGLPAIVSDDLAQEVMVRLLRTAKFDGASPLQFRAYVNKVCRSVAVDYKRRAQRYREIPMGSDVELWTEAPLWMESSSSEETADTGPTIHAFRASLSESDERLLDYILAGRKPKEVAAKLNAPLGTVYVWLHRLRRRLREALGRSP